MVPVRFLKGWSPYNSGEIAGFADETAKKLIAGGFAEPYTGDAAAEASPEAAVVTAPEKAVQPRPKGR